MKRPTKGKALIAGSSLAMAGALAGAVTLFSGGQGTAHPSAAGPAGAVRAQHVDLADPSASASAALVQPDPNAAPAQQPDPNAAPDGHKFLDLKVKNANNFQVQACVDNSAVGTVCTRKIGSFDQNDELQHVDVTATDDDAVVTADIPTKGTGGNLTHTVTLKLPVTLNRVTTHCVRFTETTIKKVTTRDLVEVPNCIGF
jgi:hypothetical protein